MKKLKRSASVLLWCFVLALSLVCAASAVAQDIGEAGEVQNQAEVLRAGQVQPEPLRKGDRVALQDKVATKGDSKVWLKLQDRSHNSLGAGSAVYLNDFGSQGSSTYYHGHVGSGAVRFIVKLERTTPKSSYVITTPTALINVEPTDRAADFVVQIPNELQTVVTVIWGKVTVKNILEEIKPQRTLVSCQEVYVDANKEPSKVYGVSSDLLRQLIKKTTIPGTLPEDVPDCEAREARCPCPAGYAKDADGRCKLCAFYAGAVYDPELCQCVCPCPQGSYAHPIDGSCVTECPTMWPIFVGGLVPPNPDVLPHEGCPQCACCPFETGCLLSFPGDPSCPSPPCGTCNPPAIPGLPPIVIPPNLMSFYDCGKCCECDQWVAPGGVPCGLNAAGLPSWACGGPKCISADECVNQGGFFIQTEETIPGRPCWVCQREAPVLAMKMAPGKGGGKCDECKRITYKKGKAECIPVKSGIPCYKDGKCGKCRDGKCVPAPPCPKGQQRNAKCDCEALKEPVPPPTAPECASDDECRKKTAGLKPCCIDGACQGLRRCPDGKYMCRCKEEPPVVTPPVEPTPPGVVPIRCGWCEVLWQGRCVPCSKINMICEQRTGRCIPRPTEEPEKCSSCQVLIHGKCVPCGQMNMICQRGTGKCIPKPPEPEKCRRCEVLSHGKCVPCGQLNMACAQGRCVTKPPTAPSEKPPKLVPTKCPACTVRVGDQCVPCAQRGMTCVGGTCVERAPTPTRVIEPKPKVIEPKPKLDVPIRR